MRKEPFFYRVNTLVVKYPGAYLIVALLAATILAVGGVTYTWSQVSRDKSSSLNNRLKWHIREINLHTIRNDISALVKYMGSHDIFFMDNIKKGNRQIIKQYLRELTRGYRSTSSLVLDKNGSVFCLYTERETCSHKEIEYTNRPCYLAALKGRVTVQVAENRLTGEPELFYSSPIKDKNGNFFGAVIVTRKMTEIHELVNSSTDPVFLLSPRGMVFMSNRNEYTGLWERAQPRELFTKIKESGRFHTVLSKGNYKRLPFSLLPQTEINGKTHMVARGYLEWDDADGSWELVITSDTSRWLALHEKVMIAGSVLLATLVILFLFYQLSRFVVLTKKNEEALAETEKKLYQSQEAGRVGTWSFDQDTGETWWSPQMYELFCINDTTEYSSFNDVMSMIVPEDRELMAARLQSAEESGTLDVEFQVVARDGTMRILHIQGKEQTQSGEGRILSGIMQDITESRMAQLKIQKLSMSVEQSPVTIVITDPGGSIEYVNPQFSRLTGYAEHEVIGKNPRVLKSGVHDEEFYADLWGTVISGKVWHGELCNRAKDGSLFWERTSISPVFDSRDRIINYVAVKEDFTVLKNTLEELKESEAVMTKLARTDALTGLNNRRYFMELAENEFNKAIRYNKNITVLMLDVDHFKNINDTWGHDAGDAILVQLSTVASSVLRSHDILGRIGGEEFALVLPETGDTGGCEVGERLRHEIETTEFIHDDKKIEVTISVGCACSRDGLEEFSDMLKAADRALYHAKETGRNRLVKVKDIPDNA